MSGRNKRSAFVVDLYDEYVDRLDPERVSADRIPVRISEDEYEYDGGAEHDDEDYLGQAEIESDGTGDPDAKERLVRDRATDVDKIRQTGIRPRFQLLNMIVNVADLLLKSAKNSQDMAARSDDLSDAKKSLRSSFRRLDEFVSKNDDSLLEDLHNVLSGAFVVGLAADRMSETDATRHVLNMLVEKARAAAKSKAEERHEEIDKIVWSLICDEFKQNRILKKMGNSDNSANMIIDNVRSAAEGLKPKRHIGVNTIRASIKRLSGGKKGGITRAATEKREPT